jgi:uncharacterized protein (TIRG00374 family)
VRAVLRRRFGPIIRAILSITLVAALAYHIGSSEIIGHLKAVTWETLAGVTLILATSVFFVTPRWAIILFALKYRIRSVALIGSVFVGFFFNQLLPTGVGGDVFRVWQAKRFGVPLGFAVHSVLIDRAAGVFVSFIGAVMLLPVAHPVRGQTVLQWIVILIGLATVIGLMVLWRLERASLAGPPMIAGIQRGLVSFFRSFVLLAGHPVAAVGVLILACINQLLPVGAIWLLARELQISVPPLQIAFITFVSTLAATLPISIAGWGIREGTLVALFGMYGISADTAFAVSVLYGACLTLSATPGALFLLTYRSSPPKSDFV